MPTKKLEETFYEITKERLSNTSQLKLFNLMEEQDGTRFMNIFRSYVINEDAFQDTIFFDTYEVDASDWWDTISYKQYGTPHLWWVICLMNDVKNPFEELDEGTNIKILKRSYMYTVFKEMESIGDL